MRLSGNLLAGLANSIWSALIGLAVVPFYLKYLGIEAYGLIGFFVTTQALLSLLDMGLAPTINREVARHSASGNLKEAGKLLHTLAIVYWGMAGVISLLIVLLAPLITEHWLQSKYLSQQTIEHSVILMGLVVACRWPIGLYQGALIGAQRLTVASSINMVMVTTGSLGAVAVLAFVSPTIEAFFIWQACVGLVYAITIRWAAWRIIGKLNQIRFDIDKLKSVWRFAAGMSGVAVSGIILMQLDKVILSKMLSLEDFGRYALAGVVASGLYMLLTPTFNVIYPRLSALVVTNETEKLIDLYRSGTRLLLAALFPIATAAAVFAVEILSLWTGNPSLASSTAPVVALFLIGTALNGAMHFPYALQLAYGMTRLPLTINAILVVVMIPTTIFLALQYGVVGGAAAWAVLNGIYLLIGTLLTHRSLLKGVGLKWLLCDVGMPLGLSLLVVGVVGSEVHMWGYSYFVELFIGGGLALFTFLLVVLLSPRLTRLLLENNMKFSLTRYFRVLVSNCPLCSVLLNTLRGRPTFQWGRVFDLRRKKLIKLSGFNLFVMPNDYIGRSIMDTKTYEPHVTNLVKGILKEGDVFLDVGANTGYFTMLAASLVKANGKVIAIEPNPQNLQLIYSSLLENHLSNVAIYPYAASDQATILRFTTVGSNGGVVTEHSKDQKHYLLVPAVVLDEILKNEVKIDLIKIDIEAHEPRAIRGMGNLIKRLKPKIITEFHPWAMELNNIEPPVAYLKQIYALGYKISIIEPSGNLLDVSSAEEIINYWGSLGQETLHLDLFAQPVSLS